MGIKLIGTKRTYHIYNIVFRLGEVVLREYHLFKCLLEIFGDCRKPDSFNVKNIDLIVDDKYENGLISKESAIEFKELICQFYKTSNDEFGLRKGRLLEYIITKIGTLHIDLPVKLDYLQDCQFYDGDDRIGDVDCDIDIVYYDPSSLEQGKEKIIADLIECKANVDNFLYLIKNKNPPIKKETFNKLQYMHNLTKYFDGNSNFYVSITTYTRNIDQALTVLRHLGLSGIMIRNGDDIAKRILQLQKV